MYSKLETNMKEVVTYFRIHVEGARKNNWTARILVPRWNLNKIPFYIYIVQTHYHFSYLAWYNIEKYADTILNQI